MVLAVLLGEQRFASTVLSGWWQYNVCLELSFISLAITRSTFHSIPPSNLFVHLIQHSINRFDVIATAGEETKNPKKSIPISVIVSLFVIFLAYFSMSTVLTMMLPYFEQNENAPLPHAFKQFNWPTAEYIVSFGAIFGLCASLMGSMFPLPRVIYAMSSDGLIFEFMGRINKRFKTPIYGTLLAGTLTGNFD